MKIAFRHTASPVPFGQINILGTTVAQFQALSCTRGLLFISLPTTDCEVTSGRKVLSGFMRRSDCSAEEKQGS